MLTVALTRAPLSGSAAVALERRDRFAPSSVQAVVFAVIESVGCWSSQSSCGSPALPSPANVRNAVGAPPLKFPFQMSMLPTASLVAYQVPVVGSMARALSATDGLE